MNDLDERGWSHIHNAAYHGYIKSIQRFVAASEDQLEFPTNDDRLMTPLLLAVDNNKLDTVQCLVELGSDLRYVNAQNLSVVELSSMKQNVEIMLYFIKMDHPDLPVWNRLIKFASSDNDEEAESAGKMLIKLTEPGPDGTLSPNWEAVVDQECIPSTMKIMKSFVSNSAKLYMYTVLLNIIQSQKAKEQIVKESGIPMSLELFKSTSRELILAGAKMLCHLSKVREYVDPMVQHGAIPVLIKIWQTSSDQDLLVQVTDTLSEIAAASPEHRQTVGSTTDSMRALVGLFESCITKETKQPRALLMALTVAVQKIVQDEQSNQNSFVDEGGSSALITLASAKNRELQLSAITAIHLLAKDNPHTQKIILEEGGVIPLMTLLKRSSVPKVQVCTASALWALAGENVDEQRTMAGMIGVVQLIDFLNAQVEFDILHYIGAEGLAVLARGPHNKQNVIAQANGVQPLVRLLRSPKEHIVLSSIRALRHLCVGIGYIPHKENQDTVLNSRGIRYLVALMVHSRNELIRVESALTLGCCSIGNPNVMDDISDNMDFNFVHILRLLYSKDDLVRLLAGSALAAFAFNNTTQQHEIADSGGVRYHCFVSFLESDDEFYRCNAAFQVVVLARIVPDEEQASSSAVGIKLIVDLLETSKNESIQALASDCLARLAHTRAGVPAAIISINAIHQLCRFMLSEDEQVRGSAAIALGYLSFNHKAERELLNKCRQDPYLFKVLEYYTSNYRLAGPFLDAWKHYKHIGLPQIDTSQRPCLVAKKNVPYLNNIKNPNMRQYTILSFGENGLNPQLSSPTNQMSSNYHDDATVVTESHGPRQGSSHQSTHSRMSRHRGVSHPSTARSRISSHKSTVVFQTDET
ncbi:ankyrin and armadillo repeat-containing protein-like [Asterias rubens]|uniref:ankyrin and armadillo repeat-containing protein-like n=1 Tax=Asterias rubens TaxID=7604 RepID=UPI001455081F|nr:ankyrin and armadillo repeat-containing protein-like [Asterias rubens]